MWIKVTDNSDRVHWVNGSRIVRMRQVQGVREGWTEVHFEAGQWITVKESVEELIGLLA
jgi:hypothetical protein